MSYYIEMTPNVWDDTGTCKHNWKAHVTRKKNFILKTAGYWKDILCWTYNQYDRQLWYSHPFKGIQG